MAFNLVPLTNFQYLHMHTYTCNDAIKGKCEYKPVWLITNMFHWALSILVYHTMFKFWCRYTEHGCQTIEELIVRSEDRQVKGAPNLFTLPKHFAMENCFIQRFLSVRTLVFVPLETANLISTGQIDLILLETWHQSIWSNSRSSTR